MQYGYVRETEYKIYKDGSVVSPYGRTMSPWIENNSGYYLFRVRRYNKPLCLRLHRVLAEAFIPNPEDKPFVRHLNDIKTDNRLCNLAWGDNPTNTKEGYDNGCYQLKARSHSILVIHKKTGEMQIFKSLRSASEELNLNRKNLAATLKGKKNNTYDYEFKYLETPND